MHLVIDRRLADWGLTTFASIFDHPEARVISGHPLRNVALLAVGTERFFLKRQLRVPWKDYISSWRAGFGWVDRSRREWQTLLAVRGRGIACPEPWAVGYQEARSFLLVRQLDLFVDLHAFLTRHRQDRSLCLSLAEEIGCTVARLHGAGFTHPDLYAKHVLVRCPDLNIALIDFQRTTWHRHIPWRLRWRDLAALDASLGDHLADAEFRFHLLHTYLREVKATNLAGEAVQAIRQRSIYLQRRSKIQAMRHPWQLLPGPPDPHPLPVSVAEGLP